MNIVGLKFTRTLSIPVCSYYGSLFTHSKWHLIKWVSMLSAAHQPNVIRRWCLPTLIKVSYKKNLFFDIRFWENHRLCRYHRTHTFTISMKSISEENSGPFNERQNESICLQITEINNPTREIHIESVSYTWAVLSCSNDFLILSLCQQNRFKIELQEPL